MTQDDAERRDELPALRQRMTEIKEEVAGEVDRKWASQYRTPDMFDLKVNARLAAHQEYRALQDQVREAEAKLAADSDANPK